MKIIEIKDKWKVKNPKKKINIPATVPGCIHTDLIAAKMMDDPMYRDNEKKVQWIENEDWLYYTTFNVSSKLLKNERLMLRFKGLDTLATITLNGKKIAKTDNMHRIWEFDVKNVLKTEKNKLEVLFTSTMPYLRKEQKVKNYEPLVVKEFEAVNQGLLRKMQSNYGWDWGIRLVTCGMWRPVELVAFSTARIKDVLTEQAHQKALVDLKFKMILDVENLQTYKAVINVKLNGKMKATQTFDVNTGVKETELQIKNPALWWPNNMGAQPLYDVEVKLFDETGKLLDKVNKRIGLREMKVIRKKDSYGETFYFTVNGTPFFAKGANWITAEPFPSAVTYDTYKKLLLDAKEANMNFIRVWGGGVYEHDEFYEICDELGLCVWQDFMAACQCVPVYNKAFIDNFCKEAEDNVKRLRHHPCIAIWCGNNELEQGHITNDRNLNKMLWKEYIELFDIGLHNVVKLHDPERLYWPCSPHSPSGDRKDHGNPKYGDSHVWNVWHGGATFEYYLTCKNRFVSEFGFQSFPEFDSVKKFTLPEDRELEGEIMRHHQRCRSGNTQILDFVKRYFKPAKDLEATLTLSQIMQSMGIEAGVEHFRRIMPVCMGTIYWQINDCWPVASWSSIDYYGRWKALHFIAKRFFAPLYVSGVYDAKKGNVSIFAINDLRTGSKVNVSWSLYHLNGKKVAGGKSSEFLKPGTSVKVKNLNVKSYLKKHGENNLALFLTLENGGKQVSNSIVLFVLPKELNQERPSLKFTVTKAGKDAVIKIKSTDTPSLWTWFKAGEANIRFSDNFFHLEPNKAKTITAKLNGMTFESFKKNLEARNLTSTY